MCVCVKERKHAAPVSPVSCDFIRFRNVSMFYACIECYDRTILTPHSATDVYKYNV